MRSGFADYLRGDDPPGGESQGDGSSRWRTNNRSKQRHHSMAYAPFAIAWIEATQNIGERRLLGE
jgi:hypothetical protein